MGYEIDFVQVGDESKSGDAIALRWGDLLHNNGEQFVVVIDGGYAGSGEKLAELIETYYKTDTIDLVVSTHPDTDHISGLSHILDSFTVKKLWIHQPWAHNEDIAAKFKDGRVTDESIGRRLKESCDFAWKLYDKAKQKGIVVEEPFSCKTMSISACDGELRILGPSVRYYEELLPQFGGMPESAQTSSSWGQMARRVANWIQELWDKDSIDNEGETSAKNNSSVILEFVYAGKRLLFTADAGIPALEEAVLNAGGEELKMVQIPHHGSRRNVGSTVLNSLVGDIVARGSPTTKIAVVSCAKENPDNKHPNKRVLNAFTRRGCRCYQVRSDFCHASDDAPDRAGYSPAEECEFYDRVEPEE